VGRQAAKIRCRKCEYLIQIAYRPNSDEFDVTASPPTVAPPPPSAPPPLRAPKAAAAGTAQPAAPNPATASNVGAAPRARLGPPGVKEEGSASKKPTAAVPGLPGLGSPKSRSGAALLSDPSGLARRPLAPLPPPPVPPLGAAGLSGPPSGPSAAPAAASAGGLGVLASPPPPSPPPGLGLSNPAAAPARAGGSTQLADQFRESVQAGGAPEDLPQEGWFVGVNGVPLGPIPLGDLRELAMAGHIDRRSLVWRDGQSEWRPLGKFPGLARVIDDGASPALPRAEPTGVSRANGANGHMASAPAAAGPVATGFDVPRADAGERPSAWGDLDDEDDEDEQPTTVKGRVSVMPAGNAPPSQVSLPSLASLSSQASLPSPASLPAPPPPALGSSAPLLADAGAGSAPASSGAAASATGAPGPVRMRASALANRASTVVQGSMIPAVLETGFDSTSSGFARAIVSRDVRSFDGSAVLIPRGSRLIGEYRGTVAQGQQRAIITWTRLIRPDGMTIAMDSPAVDTVGRGGIRASVNTHFFARLGDAFLQSTIDLGRTLTGRSGAGSVVVVPGASAATAAGQAATTNSYAPTLSVRPGRSISVFVAHDLDFSAAGSRE